MHEHWSIEALAEVLRITQFPALGGQCKRTAALLRVHDCLVFFVDLFAMMKACLVDRRASAA